MTSRIVEWAKTHQGAAAGAGAAVLVGGAALYSRYKTGAASTVVPAVAAAPTTDVTGTDTASGGASAAGSGGDNYSQFADALSQFADQQQQTAQATVDALAQLSAQQQQTAAGIAPAITTALAAAQPATAPAPRPAPTASLFQSTAGGQNEQTLQQVADRYRMSTAEIQKLNPGISLSAPLASGTKIQVNKPYSEIANLPPEHVK